MAGRLEDRVSREEFYPRVGQPAEALKALIPTFGEGIIGALIGALDHGVTKAELELVTQGDTTQTLRVIIETPIETGSSHLRVRLEGDWANQEGISSGLPLIADYDGAFFRKMRPDDPEPVTKEGMLLGPDDPIGVASKGKGNFWMYRLPRGEFPNGGRLNRFIQPDGGEVRRGESIICYVERL